MSGKDQYEQNKKLRLRIRELEDTLAAVHSDLLMRAEMDDDDFPIVSVGSSVWVSVLKALRLQ